MPNALLEEMLQIAAPISSLQCDGRYYKHCGFAIFRTKLGNNETGGCDYWITIRSFGDKISKSAELIGIVEGDRVQVGDYIPLAVAEHLQAHLQDACLYYEGAINPRDDELEYDQMRLAAGPLAFLSPYFARNFVNPTRYYDGPWVTSGMGKYREARDVTERFFVTHSKSELKALQKDVGTTTLEHPKSQ